MTPDEIEQMKADIEAGTPGPWVISGKKTIRTAHFGHWVAKVLWFRGETNARRIARVPELEAEVLRLRILLERGHSLIAGDLVGRDWKIACREFCKDSHAAINGEPND